MLKWLGLGALVVVLDQLTKAWVSAALAPGERVAVAPLVSLVRWHNEGAAFSMLSDAGGWQRWLFVLLAVGFLAFILYELRRMPREARLMGWVYGLIAGGAVGNVVDRVLHGHVVDFVLLHQGQYYFPAFNVADAALTVGAGLWIYAMLAEHKRERQRQSS
ncbi:MAG: signal peptidase II [Pseudomonadota bacterium]